MICPSKMLVNRYVRTIGKYNKMNPLEFMRNVYASVMGFNSSLLEEKVEAQRLAKNDWDVASACEQQTFVDKYMKCYAHHQKGGRHV